MRKKREQEIEGLFKLIGLEIPDSEGKQHFFAAVTHKSFLLDNEDDPFKGEYDRLEFLGDSVLKLVINELIFRKFPDYDSGQMTELSAYLLSDKTLLRIAHSLNFKSFVRTGSRIKQDAVLSDVMEALLGACYVVFGFQRTEKLIHHYYRDLIDEANANELKGNYKAALQELTQSKQLGLPAYKVVNTEGPPHNPSFEVETYLKGKILGTGRGSSKKEASQMAAKNALDKLANKQISI